MTIAQLLRVHRTWWIGYQVRGPKTEGLGQAYEVEGARSCRSEWRKTSRL